MRVNPAYQLLRPFIRYPMLISLAIDPRLCVSYSVGPAVLLFKQKKRLSKAPRFASGTDTTRGFFKSRSLSSVYISWELRSSYPTV